MKNLPIATTAEKAALSLISIDPDVLPHLAWSSDLFALDQHKLIFKALERVYQRTGSTNALGAISDLETTGKLNAAGGKEGVMEDLKTIFMSAGSMCVETAEDYRQQLLIAKSYRDAIGLWEENEADIMGMRADLSSIAESIANAIPQATQAKDVKSHLMDFLDDLDDKKPIEKFPLGIPKVDKLLGGGMQRGEMMVVGAATSG